MRNNAQHAEGGGSRRRAFTPRKAHMRLLPLYAFLTLFCHELRTGGYLYWLLYDANRAKKKPMALHSSGI